MKKIQLQVPCESLKFYRGGLGHTLINHIVHQVDVDIPKTEFIVKNKTFENYHNSEPCLKHNSLFLAFGKHN